MYFLSVQLVSNNEGITIVKTPVCMADVLADHRGHIYIYFVSIMNPNNDKPKNQAQHMI